MNHDPYSVEPRKPLTPKQRLKLFIERNGVCCICGNKIEAMKPWIDEHIIPLWLGGSNDWANRGVAHEDCARKKTAKEATERGKIQRVAEKHYGSRKKPKTKPLPGSKASGWKHRMDGSWERR